MTTQETAACAKRALTVPEAAIYLGISESSFHARIRKDPLYIEAAPEVRLGTVKGVRILRDRLDAYLEARATATQRQQEPPRLKRGREARNAQPAVARDVSAQWIGDKTPKFP